MTAWIWVLVSACVLATAITVSGCIVSGKISREEEQTENNKLDQSE